MEKIDLTKMPHLKALLINYCIVVYEEDSSNGTIDDLVTEYELLNRENRLHELFEAEWLTSTERLQEELGA